MRQSNILDPIHPALSDKLYDHVESDLPRVKSRHSHWIRRRVKDALEKAGYEHIDTWLSLVLTGSLTTFQYSDHSDVDVSLFVDSEHFPEWSRAEMIGIMVENVDGLVLPDTPWPMQCFVVPADVTRDDLYQAGLRSGYDLDLEKWIIPPERDRVHDVKAEQYDQFVYAEQCADKMERLLRYEPDRAVTYWHQIHERRRKDQKAGKGDYAQSNIIYKMLSNRGLFPEIAEVSGEYIAKVAGETVTQRLRRAEGLPPDTSDTVHEFPNGWSIKRLNTYGDMHREGDLMSNCFSPFTEAGQDFPHEAWHEHPDLHYHEDGTREWSDEIGHMDESHGYHGLYSLRDEHNLPRVSIDPYAQDAEHMALGRHNSNPKPEYAQMISEWAQHEDGYEDADPHIVQFNDLHEDYPQQTEAPWSQVWSRTSTPMTPQWYIDPRAIDKAAIHLGIQKRVKVNVEGGTHGQYQGIQNGTHIIKAVWWLNPDSANKQIWHELVHALQSENGMNFHPDPASLTHDDYRALPEEVDAHQLSESPPFAVVIPTAANTSEGSSNGGSDPGNVVPLPKA